MKVFFLFLKKGFGDVDLMGMGLSETSTWECFYDICVLQFCRRELRSRRLASGNEYLSMCL